MATSKKPPASHKRLRTCSTSCPDLSNPEAGVFTKLYPSDGVPSAAFYIHRSVSSQTFGGSDTPLSDLSDARGIPRSMSMTGEALGSLDEDEDGDTESQLRAKKLARSRELARRRRQHQTESLRTLGDETDKLSSALELAKTLQWGLRESRHSAIQRLAEVDVDVLSVSSDAIADPTYSMSAALHEEAVRFLDSEQAACTSLRRSKEDCMALLRCAEAVLAGATSNPAIAELVGVLRLTHEQAVQIVAQRESIVALASQGRAMRENLRVALAGGPSPDGSGTLRCPIAYFPLFGRVSSRLNNCGLAATGCVTSCACTCTCASSCLPTP